MTWVKQIQEGVIGKYAAEVIFFMFKIGEAMLDPTVRLYIYQTVRLQVYNNDITHLQLRDDQVREDQIQDLSATYIMAYKIVLNCPVIILGLFCGSWSDRIGRKIPVITACGGAILAVLLFMCSMAHNVPTIPLVLIGAALRGAFGKSAVVTMALHSYITDISDHEERTKRLGSLLGMNFMGYFAGSLLTGFLLQWASFDVIFCLVVVMYAACVMLAVLCMRETLPDDSDLEDVPTQPASVAVTTGENSSRSSIFSAFSLEHVRASLDVLLRPRPDRQRLYLWYFFLCVSIQQLCKSGEVDITLLYTKRSPLSWNKSLYGYFLAADYAALSCSVMLFLPILVRYGKLQDITLVAVGVAFKVTRLTIISAAEQTWLVFLSAVVGSPAAMIVSGAKSLISKTVGEHEIGKAFSLLSCLETVSNLIGSVIFTNVYVASAGSIFPGFTFAMDAVFNGLLFISCVVLWRDIRQQALYNALSDEASTLMSPDGGHNYGSALSDPAEREVGYWLPSIDCADEEHQATLFDTLEEKLIKKQTPYRSDTISTRK